jgi:hypothetical protein
MILVTLSTPRESANIGGFGEALRVDIFLPGPASLINHHAGLDNGALLRNEPVSSTTNANGWFG